MSNRNTNSTAIDAVVSQLKVESEYLDSVIESSLEMQAILRAGRSPSPATPSEASLEQTAQTETSRSAPGDSELSIVASGLQAEHNDRLNSKMATLRTKIETDFLPVVMGRKTMIDALKTMKPSAEQTPTLTEIASQVDEPLKSDLKQLRNLIRSKLNQIHSISMGNQAVLLYTLDFYNRLLAGLSGDSDRSSYYNSSGRSHRHSGGSIVRTNC